MTRAFIAFCVIMGIALLWLLVWFLQFRCQFYLPNFTGLLTNQIQQQVCPYPGVAPLGEEPSQVEMEEM